ncbi:hypothetical protein [Paenibacillus sp. S02]|nr:hypothetical protein [Paenibacillus sp. S02]
MGLLHDLFSWTKVKDLQAGNIKVQTVQDLDRLIELDTKLQKDEI